MYDNVYGQAPKDMGIVEIYNWEEYMHYMYLPVAMPICYYDVRIPRNLSFARSIVYRCMEDYSNNIDTLSDKYVYLTTRRGWASPGNPLNRPGWHADGFGGNDVNYVWTDNFPTLFALQSFEGIDPDHTKSIDQFTEQIAFDKVVTYPDKTLLRIDPYVVHHVPMDIPAPGGNRSFLKVSISKDRYDLKGNAHNWEFAYDWVMYDRTVVRNDPARHHSDSSLVK